MKKGLLTKLALVALVILASPILTSCDEILDSASSDNPVPSPTPTPTPVTVAGIPLKDATSANVSAGYIVAADGKVYPTLTDVTGAGTTAEAVVVFINETGQGFALAVSDEAISPADFDLAIATCEAKTPVFEAASGTNTGWNLPRPSILSAFTEMPSSPLLGTPYGYGSLRTWLSAAGADLTDGAKYWAGAKSVTFKVIEGVLHEVHHSYYIQFDNTGITYDMSANTIEKIPGASPIYNRIEEHKVRLVLAFNYPIG